MRAEARSACQEVSTRVGSVLLMERRTKELGSRFAPTRGLNNDPFGNPSELPPTRLVRPRAYHTIGSDSRSSEDPAEIIAPLRRKPQCLLRVLVSQFPPLPSPPLPYPQLGP